MDFFKIDSVVKYLTPTGFAKSTRPMAIRSRGMRPARRKTGHPAGNRQGGVGYYNQFKGQNNPKMWNAPIFLMAGRARRGANRFPSGPEGQRLRIRIAAKNAGRQNGERIFAEAFWSLPRGAGRLGHGGRQGRQAAQGCGQQREIAAFLRHAENAQNRWRSRQAADARHFRQQVPQP